MKNLNENEVNNLFTMLINNEQSLVKKNLKLQQKVYSLTIKLVVSLSVLGIMLCKSYHKIPETKKEEQTMN